MKPEIEKGINLIINECEKNGQVYITMCTPEAIHNAIPKAKTLELVQKKGKHSYGLTNKGLRAIELGGVSQYLKDLKSKEDKEALLTDLSIEQLKGSIFQVKYWWLLLLISGFIGFITGNIEFIIGWFK